jgi:diguanylate cyclase (GGDEF)-like protein
MSDSTLALRRQPRDSLATKIIFFVFFSTFVTALIVSWISVHATYSFLRTHLDASYPMLAERGTQRLGAWIEDGQGSLLRLARDADVGRASGGSRDDREAAETALAGALDSPSPFTGLVVTDAEGNPIASATTTGLPVRLTHDLVAASDATLRDVDGRLVASTPIRDDQGSQRGTLHGVFAAEPLATHLDIARGPEEAQLYLLDSTGRVLAASAPQEAIRFEAFPVEFLQRGPRAKVAEFRSPQNRRGIGTLGRLPFLDWSVAVAQPLESAFAPVFSVVTRVFVIDLAIILVFSFLAYEITAKIVRPLEALSDGARRISQGELEVEIPDTNTHDEIGLLTGTFNDMARRLRRNRDELDLQHRQLREQNEELQRANEVLEQLSITDGLTKLHNHRYFQESLTREIKRVSRSGDPLSILLADIDDFKGFNDRYGHAEGDALLMRIARVLNESVRESDILARYGGEEFVVLATGTDQEGALFVAEKIRTAVAETAFVLHGSLEPLQVTISIGVAEFAGDRKRFFHAADRALYRAKAAGKNCVMAAEPRDLLGS